MKLNDELFDKKVKEKLKLENNVLPDYANNASKNNSYCYTC